MRTIVGFPVVKIGIALVVAILMVLCVTLVYRIAMLNLSLAATVGSRTNNLACLPDTAVKHLKTVPKLTFKCLPSSQVSKDMSLTQARVNMFTYIQPTVKCDEVTRYGAQGYGGWSICTAGPFNPVANKCLVYSFGIENDWTFDEFAVRNVKCEVHSFDPTIGLKDHRRQDGIMFHNLGLSGSDQINEKGWPLKTLCSIMRDLGHEHQTIDVLKFDIEYSEWGAIEAMKREGCLKYVRQMVFEIHMWTDEDPKAEELLKNNGFPPIQDTVQDYTMYYESLRYLQDAGFRAWMIMCVHYTCFKPRDQPNIRYCPQCDVGYINTNFIT